MTMKIEPGDTIRPHDTPYCFVVWRVDEEQQLFTVEDGTAWWPIDTATLVGKSLKRVQLLESALYRIAKWHCEFPPSMRKDEYGNVMTFGEAFGSNGERDFMRNIAQDAIDGKETK